MKICIFSGNTYSQEFSVSLTDEKELNEFYSFLEELVETWDYSSVESVTIEVSDEEIFTFGKHKGVKVDKILETEPGYFSWIQNADFPLYTKKVLTAIKLRKLNNKLS